MKRSTSLFAALLLTATLTAQTEKPASAETSAGKGVVPISPPHEATARVAPATRAVVVGISDYQDPAIPDLRFPDCDAEAFAAWLRSPAGERLPETQPAAALFYRQDLQD